MEAGLKKCNGEKNTDYFEQNSPMRNYLREHTASHRTPSILDDLWSMEYLAYIFSVPRKVKAINHIQWFVCCFVACEILEASKRELVVNHPMKHANSCMECPNTRALVSYSSSCHRNHVLGMLDEWERGTTHLRNAENRSPNECHSTTPEFWPIKILNTCPSWAVFFEMVIIYSAQQYTESRHEWKR